jgi:hypothetical protein
MFFHLLEHCCTFRPGTFATILCQLRLP